MSFGNLLSENVAELKIVSPTFSPNLILEIGMHFDKEHAKLCGLFSTIYPSTCLFVCLCWGFTAQSTQWGHVERGQFT